MLCGGRNANPPHNPVSHRHTTTSRPHLHKVVHQRELRVGRKADAAPVLLRGLLALLLATRALQAAQWAALFHFLCDTRAWARLVMGCGQPDAWPRDVEPHVEPPPPQRAGKHSPSRRRGWGHAPPDLGLVPCRRGGATAWLRAQERVCRQLSLWSKERPAVSGQPCRCGAVCGGHQVPRQDERGESCKSRPRAAECP